MTTLIGGHSAEVTGNQPVLMGVINMTPDSFSDGGDYNNLEAALIRCRQLVTDGAQILDIGGESTRPGASRVAVEVEIERVVPLIEALVAADWFKHSTAQISIDTMNSATALAAVAAGAHFVNDVSGGKADAHMLASVATTNAVFILSHWRGFSHQMDQLNEYSNLAVEVAAELSAQVSLAESAGIARERIVVDPGLGFSKLGTQNWQLLAGLGHIMAIGLPVLVGASRKRFVAEILNPEDPASVTNDRRDAATAIISVNLAQRGIWGLRVHNIALNADALAVAAALQVAGNQKASES